MATITADRAGSEDFAALLDETLGADTGFAGSVVTGKVIRVDDDVAVVDVGLKSEGRVPLKEFAAPGQKAEVKPGDLMKASSVTKIAADIGKKYRRLDILVNNAGVLAAGDILDASL